MNILLINHYAGSLQHGMEYRPYYLAREWVRLGHRVQIVAAACSHLRQQAPQLFDAARLEEHIDGIEYCWLSTPTYQGNGAGRVANMLAFVTRLWREGVRLSQAFLPDAVIASSTYPLDIWPAHRLARLAGARLVHEIHDLWPLTPIELGGYSPHHPFIRLLQAAEDHACRHADAVVSILPKVGAHLASRGLAAHKLHLIPNGVDPCEWQVDSAPLAAPLKAQLELLRREGRIIVGYAGSHGLANALDTLLDAAALLRTQRFGFLLVGSGAEKARLREQAIARGIQHVLFADPVPKRSIPTLLRQFDIAYLGWQRQSLYRFGIAPNKLLDYMMAARPVLHAVEAGNDPVAEARCGLSVAPGDAQALAGGLLRMAGLSQEQRQHMGERGQAYALATQSYPVLAQRFLAVLDQENHYA